MFALRQVILSVGYCSAGILKLGQCKALTDDAILPQKCSTRHRTVVIRFCGRRKCYMLIINCLVHSNQYQRYLIIGYESISTMFVNVHKSGEGSLAAALQAGTWISLLRKMVDSDSEQRETIAERRPTSSKLRSTPRHRCMTPHCTPCWTSPFNGHMQRQRPTTCANA